MKKSSFIIIVILLHIFNGCSSHKKESDSDNEYYYGISNEGKNLDKPYLTPGDRTYIIGTQDGCFPDMGSHVKGEMGGLWMHPIKLMDGFWMQIIDQISGSAIWLEDAVEFINYPHGNKFVYASVLGGILVERFQFCPQGKEGMVIKYDLKNTSNQIRKLSLNFVAKTDISPVWFSKENNIIDAVDTIMWDESSSVFLANDTKNPWYCVWGSTLPVYKHSIQANPPIETIGLGKSASSYYQIEIKPKENVTATFIVSGSNLNLQTAMNTYTDLYNDYDKLLDDKIYYYNEINNRAKIYIPDKELQQAYNWGKINTEWLVMELPEIGRFLGAGAIEYPWLFGCDNSYALQGVVASGDLELAKSTLRVIKDVSERINGNGRIIHEMSSNGFVYNKGNTQETPHFAVAVWEVFKWTGDIEFLKEMYPYIKLGINWLFTEQDVNDNLFPEGYGIMEVIGLNAELIDVAVYTQQALYVASKMAFILNEPDKEIKYAQKAALLKDRINNLFWDETNGSYCDFYGTREQAIQTAKGAIDQIQIAISAGRSPTPEIQARKMFYKELITEFKKLPEETQKGWFTNKNWVISTPMETGIAPTDKAISLLDKIHNEHCGEYGPYLSAVERRRMMTIATGVQAVAECKYGRTDEAMWYVDKIVQTFSRVLPGSFSEMMPDRGCPVQAWTIYGLAVPLVTHVFGIIPDAYNKSIEIKPHFPQSWNNFKIQDLPVGNNIITFSIQQSEKDVVYKIISKEKDWSFILSLDGIEGKYYTMNGLEKDTVPDEIILDGIKNKVVVYKYLEMSNM